VPTGLARFVEDTECLKKDNRKKHLLEKPFYYEEKDGKEVRLRDIFSVSTLHNGS